MATFDVQGREGVGYLAVPPSGNGPGVLVLHAWWGLVPFYQEVCEDLVDAGFVAFAPDLFDDKIASTIEDAQALVDGSDSAAMSAIASGALTFLRERCDGAVGVIGFSLGAAVALELAVAEPDAVAAVTLFYGCAEGNFAAAQASFLGHFAETDSWEPLEYVRQMEANIRAAGRDMTLHLYPNAQHWFAETDRPEYNKDAAELAWQRTLDFLRQHLSGT